ncbi:MAG: TetR/AcrR family transcriptional regulator [Thermodesulfobacteriota bacterium]
MDQARTITKRDEIISAAIDAFAEKGFHAAKVADIAQRISMGHGTFYRYFGSKLDIFFAVIDFIVEKIQAEVAVDEPDATNTLSEYRDQIIRMGKRIFSLFTEDARLAQIIFYEAYGADEDLNRRLDDLYNVIDRHVERYLVNGVRKGFLRKGLDTRYLSKAVRSIIFGGAKDVINARDRDLAAQRWIAAAVTLMLSGMAADPEAAASI